MVSAISVGWIADLKKNYYSTVIPTGLFWQLVSTQISRFYFAQDAIEKEDFGLDLPSAQKYQQNHHVQHDAVLAFQDELDKIKQLEVRFAAIFTGWNVVRISDSCLAQTLTVELYHCFQPNTFQLLYCQSWEFNFTAK